MTQNPHAGEPGSPLDLPPIALPNPPAGPAYGSPIPGYSPPPSAASTPGYGQAPATPQGFPGYGQVPQPPYPSPSYQPLQPYTQYSNPGASPAQDAQTNKAYAVLAYLGPLVLVPLLAAKDSAFARFHARQGLTLLVSWIALQILNRLCYLIGFGPGTWITSLASVGLLVLAVLGIVNACQGQLKKLPLIGDFRFIK
jgi:uncharacterized membrane protein